MTPDMQYYLFLIPLTAAFAVVGIATWIEYTRPRRVRQALDARVLDILTQNYPEYVYKARLQALEEYAETRR